MGKTSKKTVKNMIVRPPCSCRNNPLANLYVIWESCREMLNPYKRYKKHVEYWSAFKAVEYHKNIKTPIIFFITDIPVFIKDFVSYFIFSKRVGLFCAERVLFKIKARKFLLKRSALVQELMQDANKYTDLQKEMYNDLLQIRKLNEEK